MATPEPLAAAGARQPEGERGKAGGQTCGAPDRGEAEAARLRAERAYGGDRHARSAGAVVDRAQPIQAEARAVRGTAPGTEVDHRMGDVAGHQTHTHGRHCTPARWRCKPNSETSHPVSVR